MTDRDDHEAAPRRAAAFFDLDGTVVAKSSALAFSRAFYREGLLPRALVLKSAYAQLAFQVLGANDERMERWRAALLALMRGWDAEHVQRLVRDTLQEVIDPLVYTEALELFGEHRRAGRDLYLVSSSGIEVVRPLAEHLGIARVIATRAGTDGAGRYDGTLAFYCYSDAKAAAIHEEAERRNLDLGASYAYSDSVTDVPMLEAVGHPVAVNPDRELRMLARTRSWPVRDFVRRVWLRRRIAQVRKPPREVLAGAGALSAAALGGWRLYQRHQAPDVAGKRP